MLPSSISNVMLPVAPKFPLQHLVPSPSPGDFSLLRISQAASHLVSFCFCNKKVCRESYSWTGLLAANPLCLCWSVEVGAQHQGLCVLSSVLCCGHAQSTEAAALMCSRSCSPACPLSGCFLQALASRQSSGSPWNSSPGQQVCAELWVLSAFPSYPMECARILM